MTEQRLIDIESKVAYQEFKIEELSLLVAEQQAVVRKLEEAVRILAKNDRNANPKSLGPADQRPPHY